MRAARWIVIVTALVVAATAFHLLMSPRERPRAVAAPNGSSANSPPQDQIDAESREAMREFLRRSAQGEGQDEE